MTTTTHTTVRPADLERWMDTEGDTLVALVLDLKRQATKIRAEVDSYIEPIFHSFGFRDRRTGEPIKHHEQFYLAGETDRDAEFFAACDAAHRERGHDLRPGYCPALIAENELVQAETAAIESIGRLMGFEAWQVHGERRKQLLAILRQMFEARERRRRDLLQLTREVIAAERRK